MKVAVLIAIFFVSPLSSDGLAATLSSQTRRSVSVVTGANGYVGREIVHALLGTPSKSKGCEDIFCLVRPARVREEESYWKTKEPTVSGGGRVKVLPYDMLDGGTTLSSALDAAYQTPNADGTTVDERKTECCVYHVASVFGPTEDHVQTALDNVRGTEDIVKTLSQFENVKLVVTSSMAAVRGSGQTPKHGPSYTHRDWNTLSKLGDNWGSSYQWSKAESERRAWTLAEELGVPMVSLCPSFVFGPPFDGIETKSYSITLVGQWVRGESPVQSRLCVDVRDVAKAHVAAGTLESAVGNRYILSSEARVPSLDMAETLKKVAKQTGIGDPSKITADTKFEGGAIKIGEQEVVAAERMRQDLGGLVCRSVEETMADMGRALLKMSVVQEGT